jgi:uncharacterized membrane protein
LLLGNNARTCVEFPPLGGGDATQSGHGKQGFGFRRIPRLVFAAMLVATIGSDAYKWLLAFHILLAVVWIGSNTAIQIFVIRAKRAGADRLAYFAGEIEWYGTRILIPAALTLVVLGFLLLNESDGAWDLGQGWVMFGFVVWVLSFIAGAGYLGPESARLSKLADERSPEDPEYQRRIARIFIVSRIELLLLILVVLDMTIKPGL